MNVKPMCPRCMKLPLHRSRRRGWKDSLVLLVGMTPVRCHGCNGRYYVRFGKGQNVTVIKAKQ